MGGLQQGSPKVRSGHSLEDWTLLRSDLGVSTHPGCCGRGVKGLPGCFGLLLKKKHGCFGGHRSLAASAKLPGCFGQVRLSRRQTVSLKKKWLPWPLVVEDTMKPSKFNQYLNPQQVITLGNPKDYDKFKHMKFNLLQSAKWVFTGFVFILLKIKGRLNSQD